MAGIDDVLERLLTDAQFARHLAQDPASALAGYELTTDDLTLLSTQVSFDPGALSLVEERISKSSMFGLLTSITGGLGGGEVQLPGLPMSPEVVAPVDLEEVIGPTDSEGVISPTYIQGALDPGDKVGADGIVIVGGIQTDDVAHSAGGGGGAGLPAPGSTQGFIIEGGLGNPASEGGTQGFVIDGGIGNPEGTPAVEGVIIQGGLTDALGVVVQGGLTDADAVVVQGGLTPPDGTVFEGSMDGSDGVDVADGVIIQGGLTGPGETEGITF